MMVCANDKDLFDAKQSGIIVETKFEDPPTSQTLCHLISIVLEESPYFTYSVRNFLRGQMHSIDPTELRKTMSFFVWSYTTFSYSWVKVWMSLALRTKFPGYLLQR
jgi:hypothetical protein